MRPPVHQSSCDKEQHWGTNLFSRRMLGNTRTDPGLGAGGAGSGSSSTFILATRLGLAGRNTRLFVRLELGAGATSVGETRTGCPRVNRRVALHHELIDVHNVTDDDNAARHGPFGAVGIGWTVEVRRGSAKDSPKRNVGESQHSGSAASPASPSK